MHRNVIANISCRPTQFFITYDFGENRVPRSLRDSAMPRCKRTKPSLHRAQYIIPEVKNVPLLSNSPYFAARDKSITWWYIAARVYEDIKIV